MCKKNILFLILCFFLFNAFAVCGKEKSIITPDTQHRNLQKLCKVWGFAKYTHKSFLLGLKDWDTELIELVPLVCSAEEDEVNEILYEWFLALGDDGYVNPGAESVLADTDKSRLRYMADMRWLTEEYLGKPLFTVLSRFQEITDIVRSGAPVFFDQSNNSIHSNDDNYENMDYNNTGYRLLGLFRLWNAMEYYFPYMDILDDDWNELLLEHIPMMLDGRDRKSYELTLVSLALKLDDAHVRFIGATVESGNERYKQALNRNFRPLPRKSHVLLENNIGLINPAKLKSGEIHDIMKTFADTSGLVIDFRQYPNDFIPYSLGNYLVDIRQPFTIFSKPSMAVPGLFVDGLPSYSGRMPDEEIEKVRQFYLNLTEDELEAVRANYQNIGFDIGNSWDEYKEAYFKLNFGKDYVESYYYDKSVVLIMDETTISQPEFTIMSLRNGSNVTVIGRNSIGADGDVTYIRLPGGITMSYTGFGAYYPDGGQTQRIGLSPDIYIERTEEDIRERRDELMEAAIQFILGE